MNILDIIKSITLDIFILLLYMLPFYYIGIKIKKIFLSINKKFKIKIFWFIYWVISLSYVLSAIFRNYLTINNLITRIFTVVGAFSLGIMLYSVLIFMVIDILKIIFRKVQLGEKIRSYLRNIYFNGISVFIVVFILIGFGMYNAQKQVITTYNININKNAGKNTSLNIVMISDTHIGIATREKDIDKMVKRINSLNPDIVFFCGDIADENTTTNLKMYYKDAFKNIKSKYGSYGVTGNHEYFYNLDESLRYLQEGNVKLLEDDVVKIDNSFYVVGRNDNISENILKHKVKSLNEILKDTDKSFPIIVLNHKPINLEEAEEEKVDLQLSGHTHKGQVFPGNLFTKLIFEDDYGYIKKGNLNLIVTSGYGTWGPPIRIGTKGEIVNVKVNFKK